MVTLVFDKSTDSKAVASKHHSFIAFKPAGTFLMVLRFEHLLKARSPIHVICEPSSKAMPVILALSLKPFFWPFASSG